MNKFLLVLLFQIFNLPLLAQTNEEIAFENAKKAIQIMDEGKIDESIAMLKESEKLDPKNYLYLYEIAYAHVLKKDYDKALKILKKLKRYKTINSQVYQMSGNCYSYLGNPEKAIKEYEEGMSKFPNAGNLHLEKGNVYLGQENYKEAIKNYELGIQVDPMFPSNYFRLAKLFLDSKDKLSGLIYGEIFMNLERTTPRTKEMSKLLFETYQSAIIINDENIGIEFCEIILDADALSKEPELKLPLCAVFGKNFIMAIIDEKEINLSTLANIRSKFLENYYQEDFENYPNVLFEYHKKMVDYNLFDAYNHYVFQMGAQPQFDSWLEDHQNEYELFTNWYTSNDNALHITNENMFIR